MIKLITNTEEFAYNTNTTTSDDTTSFGYGPEGVLLGAYHTGAEGFITKQVSFKSPILPTDVLVIEYSTDRLHWATVSHTYFGATSQGTARYGLAMSSGIGSNYCTIFFGAKGAHATGAFGAVGASYITTHYWRVRKSSSTSAQAIENASVTRPGMVTTSAQEFAGSKTFLSTSSVEDGVVVAGRAGGTSSYRATITPGTLTASRTYTLPNATGSFIVSQGQQTINNSDTFGALTVGYHAGTNPYGFLGATSNGTGLVANGTLTYTLGTVGTADAAFLVIISFSNSGTAGSAAIMCGYGGVLPIMTTNTTISAGAPSATGLGLSYVSATRTLTITAGASLAIGTSVYLNMIGARS